VKVERRERLKTPKEVGEMSFGEFLRPSSVRKISIRCLKSQLMSLDSNCLASFNENFQRFLPVSFCLSVVHFKQFVQFLKQSNSNGQT
jgi:hypothetical protein